MHLHVCRYERAYQPRPDCPLVIRRISTGDPTLVSRTIGRIVGRKTAKAGRREEFTLDHFHNLPSAFPGDQLMPQADCKDLIRADGGIAMIAIDDIEQTARFSVPKLLSEAAAGLIAELGCEQFCVTVA